IAEAAARVEVDVLSVHRVVRQAAQQQDVELLMTMLSGRDPRWTEAQKALAAGGLLFGRSSFGFETAPAADFAATKTGSITVTLSADLKAAELTWLEPFVVNRGEANIETVRLAQTAVYRQGARSWLLSPPEREFWGEWEQVQGAYTTLTYPTRDEQVARRLVHDLDAAIVRVCTRLEGITCPANLGLRLRLETDTESLLAVHNVETMLMSGRSLTLPTPTLVGLPIDEAGYQALVRGYAIHVVSALITDLVEYECCQRDIFYMALLDKQLSQLGLRPWPLTQADYDGLLDHHYSRGDMNVVWTRASFDSVDDTNRRRLYTVVDFVLSEAAPQATAAGMQRRLDEADSYWTWLRFFIPDHITPEQFDTRWLRFVYRQTASVQLPPPIPLPAQDIQLVCQPPSGLSGGIYRFDVETATWSTEFEYQAEPGFSSYAWPLLGQPHLYAVHEYASNPEPGQQTTRLSLWRDGEELVEFEQTADEAGRVPTLYFSSTDPKGRYLMMVSRYQSDESAEYQLLDLHSCRNLRCNMQPLLNWPTWSPDGAHTLMFGQPLTATTKLDEGYWPWLTPLLRADARGRAPIQVGVGARPFWFTSERYGYIRVNSEAEFELVMAIVGDDRPHVLLSADQLRQVLREADRPQRMFLDYALPNPADSRQLLVKAASSPSLGEHNYYFRLTLDSQWAVRQISLVHQTDEPGNLTLSPDGRWLTFHTYGSHVQTTELVDLEMETYKSYEHSSFSPTWSAGGQWLAYNNENHLVLMAPAYDYRQLFFHEFEGCYRADWID
ncbi:MAG TPA: hypothetical protein VF177_16735, partial [Anaerolineae bacterium]